MSQSNVPLVTHRWILQWQQISPVEDAAFQMKYNSEFLVAKDDPSLPALITRGIKSVASAEACTWVKTDY